MILVNNEAARTIFFKLAYFKVEGRMDSMGLSDIQREATHSLLLIQEGQEGERRGKERRGGEGRDREREMSPPDSSHISIPIPHHTYATSGWIMH